MKLSNTYNGETKSVYIGAKNQNLITQSEEYFWKVRGYIEKLNTLYADFSLKDVAQLTESELLE
jgi:hypothetical protein